jgi:hypothetical protein
VESLSSRVDHIEVRVSRLKEKADVLKQSDKEKVISKIKFDLVID